MDSFKKSFLKDDGKLNISLILLKLAFLAFGILYLVLFLKFKDFSIGSYLYPPHPFGLLHFVLLLPGIASFAFALLAVNHKWSRVLWQTGVIMISCLVIAAVVSVFTGMKSVTTDAGNYLVLDSYFEEEEQPAADKDSNEEPTFLEVAKKLMPEQIPAGASGVDYYYYYTSLPVIGGNFDVYASWRLDSAELSSEAARLASAFPNAKNYNSVKDPDNTYYLIRSDDKNGEYYYVFYGINTKKGTITYNLCYSEKSSEKPHFETKGIDLGRRGKTKEEDIVVESKTDDKKQSVPASEPSSDVSQDEPVGDSSQDNSEE